MSLRRIRFALMAVAIGATACGKDEPDTSKREFTQHEKDSILGASKMPGAKAVKRALTSADSAAARQARLDSMERVP